jgi:preprotein translocase subunit SecA
LFVLGTERHEARRIDNQLRGRAGRQGDPGETLFMVSLEDQLMRVFGGDRIKNIMGTFKIPEDQPIENRMITKQLESAQARIEGFHFDSRKQVLAYDNVQNQQRQVVYERRIKLLKGDEAELHKIIDEMIAETPEVAAVVEQKQAEFGSEWNEMVRKLSLQMIDTLWVEHLEVMQYTRASVNLRAYGQKDPLNEYKREGKRLFTEMQAAVLHRMAEVLPNLQPQALEKEEEAIRKERLAAQRSGGSSAMSTPTKHEPKVAEHTPGRNDVVTITNGSETKELKFKKAEPLLAEGWQLVTKR